MVIARQLKTSPGKNAIANHIRSNRRAFRRFASKIGYIVLAGTHRRSCTRYKLRKSTSKTYEVIPQWRYVGTDVSAAVLQTNHRRFSAVQRRSFYKPWDIHTPCAARAATKATSSPNQRLPVDVPLIASRILESSKSQFLSFSLPPWFSRNSPTSRLKYSREKRKVGSVRTQLKSSGGKKRR